MKPLITTLLLLLLTPSLFSQTNFNRHEFSVFGSFGFTGLKKNISSGEKSLLQGGSFGVDYTYSLSPQWGILSGVELAFYEAVAEIRYNSPQLETSYKSTSEKINFLQIPLMSQFQTRGKNVLYLAGGFKAGFPVYKSFPVDIKTVYILSGETGMKWKLNPKFSLYTGMYGDMGLNKIIENPTNPEIRQNRNSILSRRTVAALSLKIRLSFHMG